MIIFRFFAVAALSLAMAAPSFAKSPTRVRLLPSPSPSKVGQTVRLLAEVDGLGGGAPVGTVSFADGYTPLGKSALSAYGAGQQTLAANYGIGCALTAVGGLACWGNNDRGQLGDGTTTNRHSPVSVSGLSSGVVAVTTGGDHTCAVTLAGAAMCWGSNDRYGLGDGTTTEHHAPVSVSGLSSGVVAITAGGATCALTSAGAVKCWGWNMYGQVGDGTSVWRSTPVSVPGLSSGVVAISAGGYHTCALTNAGAVKCWGGNWFGQLGDGTTETRTAPVSVSGLSSGVVAISTGSEHSCALTNAGAVKCWGRNAYGQLGDGSTSTRRAPVAVWGLSSGVVAISAGGVFTCALTSSGAVKCWGANGRGTLGDGTTVNRFTPVAVAGLSSGVGAIATGWDHGCALTISGAATCWGSNASGQLGDGTARGRPYPVAIPAFASLVRARASLSTSALGLGAHTLRAGFGGDVSHGSFIGSAPHRVVE